MALKFRRGTTAQKSGSLAFGEPYVNTTLGTLEIGLESGDVTLSAIGTGSNLSVAGISGSSLDITGDAKIDGNLTLGGNITIGNSTTDTISINADLSSSLIPDTTNTVDLGSSTKVYKTIYGNTLSGSVLEIMSGSNPELRLTNKTTGIQYHIQNGDGGNFQIHNGTTEKLLFRFQSASLAEGNQDGYFYSNLIVSESVSSYNLIASYVSASTFSGLGNLTAYSSSVDSKITALQVETSNLETFSGSQLDKDATLATYTASVENRLATLGGLTGSFARTDSANVFTGNQTISGSLIVSQDLTVLGSSSIQNISSSNLVIGAAFVTLNTAVPSSRYAGLQIIDSGSIFGGASGSFLYDAVDDEFIFVHRGNGMNVTSSHFILGPETYDNLGNETYITANRLPKGAGNEHLVDSTISDDGTTVSITGTGGLYVMNALTASAFRGAINATNGVVSGSSQVIAILGSLNTYTGSNDSTNTTQNSRLTTLEASASNALVTNNGQGISITNLNSFSSSALTRLTALEVETANLETFTSSINTTIKSKLDADGVISGSSQLTTTFDARYLNTGADGVVSGSSQISHDSTTGYSANRHIDHTTVSISAGSGLSGGGDISATRTLSIATGGVTNGMLANSTISGISLGSNLATLTIGTGLSGTSYNGSGAVTIANTGVTSNVAGTGVSVSGATGAVTISIGQSVATSANAQFNSLGIGMAASATAGRIDATNDIVAFSSSDIRFKENIKAIENPIDKIRKISGNTYDWKAENKAEHGYEGNDVGVIAQEIEAVLPQLVQTRENGYKAVKYDKLVALLIEGIKEQQLQIEDLKIEVKALKTQKGL